MPPFSNNSSGFDILNCKPSMIKRCDNSWEKDIHLQTAGDLGCDENLISSRNDWILSCGSKWYCRCASLQAPQGSIMAGTLQAESRWDLAYDLNKGSSHNHAGTGEDGAESVSPAPPPWGSSVRQDWEWGLDLEVKVNCRTTDTPWHHHLPLLYRV